MRVLVVHNYFPSSDVALEKEKRFTRAMFRQYLNEQSRSSPNWRNGLYKQRSREYGDYLYNQDRGMFEELYKEWLGTK